MKNKLDVHLGVTPTLFIGKWTVRVLFLLKERPYRHAQLRRRLGAISQRMLTRTLRNLESTGLISRKVTLKIRNSQLLANQVRPELYSPGKRCLPLD